MILSQKEPVCLLYKRAFVVYFLAERYESYLILVIKHLYFFITQGHPFPPDIETMIFHFWVSSREPSRIFHSNENLATNSVCGPIFQIFSCNHNSITYFKRLSWHPNVITLISAQAPTQYAMAGFFLPSLPSRVTVYRLRPRDLGTGLWLGGSRVNVLKFFPWVNSLVVINNIVLFNTFGNTPF